MSEVGVSVVIPTLNRDGYLGDSIRDMLAQEYPVFEIIVVDQSENVSDEIKALITENKDNLRYFQVEFRGLPQARNFGWQHAQYPIVLYIDDDIRSDCYLIQNHILCYGNTNVGLVAGGIDEEHRPLDNKEPSGTFNYWTCSPHRGFASNKNQSVVQVPGGNFSIKRTVMEHVGGVDEYLNIGAALYEETDLALRVKKLGYGIKFQANARLLHLAAFDGGCRVVNDVPKYMFGLGHNRSIVITRHLKWYHTVTAYFRLLLLGVAYSKSDVSIKPFIALLRGIVAGRRSGLKSAVCSIYSGSTGD